MKAIDRFMAKTEWSGGCLEWRGGSNSEGYGYFKVERKDWRATRWIFQYDHGYLPEVVMHSCDNPRCVNLRHLIPGTQAENMADKRAKGRANGPRRLSDADVRLIRSTYAEGDLTQRALADLYGVTRAYVSRIVRNQTRKDPSWVM